MRVMLLHNTYQHPGGEDQVFAAEGALLEGRGHEVERFTVSNDLIDGMSRAALAASTVWNRDSYRALRAQFRAKRPDVAHFHNTFPLLSPSAYAAARDQGVPVVQTLHNYRLLCVNALLFRDGHICNDCLGHPVPWQGVAHACYRGSRLASAAVATMIALHRARGTWMNDVDLYIALTEFARSRFIAGGLPAERIVVKPNFVHPDPGLGDASGNFALFVGRLVPEKGIRTLIDAWQRIGPNFPLRIVGDGPLAPQVAAAAAQCPWITWLGRRPRAEVLTLMRAATLLIFPSTWYEGFGMTVAEALAVGLPVVGSRVGGMAALIDDGRTGVHFPPGDAAALAERVQWAMANPARLAEMRREARAEYLERYTGERNYDLLLGIYERVRRGRLDA